MTETRSEPSIRGDMSRRAVAHTASMDWQPSPSGSVWRKRVHLVGGVESGQVTSIVRYGKGSRFHAHDHPDGFRHAPVSTAGCELYVKTGALPALREARAP